MAIMWDACQYYYYLDNVVTVLIIQKTLNLAGIVANQFMNRFDRLSNPSIIFIINVHVFYHYYRYKLQGIRNLIFYQLPSYPHYYSELCNMLDSRRRTVTEHTCMVLYSKYDAHRLAAVVGTDRCSHMLSTDKGVHMLVSGEDAR